MAAYSQPRREILGEPLATLFALRAAHGAAAGGSIRGIGYRMRDILRTANAIRHGITTNRGPEAEKRERTRVALPAPNTFPAKGRI